MLKAEDMKADGEFALKDFDEYYIFAVKDGSAILTRAVKKSRTGGSVSQVWIDDPIQVGEITGYLVGPALHEKARGVMGMRAERKRRSTY